MRKETGMWRKFRVALVVSLCLCGYMSVAPALAEEAKKKGGIGVEEVTYEPEGRRDPFISIMDAAKKDDDVESEEEKSKLSLENYDLVQFNLIAILWEQTRYRALVGLPDKKFYTIEVGETVGIHEGKVLEISKDSVTVREMIPDFRGELKPEDTVMKLREEEEE